MNRYGAAELYGFDLTRLSPEEIRKLSNAPYKSLPCPFRAAAGGGNQPRCNKKGGVCSLRLYSKDGTSPAKPTGEPTVTCPQRFLEDNLVFQWVGDTLLGAKNPVIISELPFLMSETQAETEDAEAVGKIDKVLVNPKGHTLLWCALEMQAVYFAGKSMENDFVLMRAWKGPGLPFPAVQRRPDFRSSGPKRLMPQLQIKVPTISRWGKKMAVVIDQAFWESLGEMREVKDLSNAEIAWFVVSFADIGGPRLELKPHELHYTTLSNAVEGLTGGTPVSLDAFEAAIRERMPTGAAK